MRKGDSKRLHRAADFTDSAATELAIAAATLEEQGDEVVAQASVSKPERTVHKPSSCEQERTARLSCAARIQARTRSSYCLPCLT